MPKIPPPTPWKAFGQTAGDVEYLVLLTHLPVRRMTALPKFLNYVRVIRKQLNAGPSGLVGYSLLAQPFSSNYWTLSAWESPAALAGFIRESPHREAMEELPKSLRDFRSWRWRTSGSSLPPSWKDALTRPGQETPP
jgi:hypothetical protein